MIIGDLICPSLNNYHPRNITRTFYKINKDTKNIYTTYT
jgi:hypothetical protein